MPADDGGRSVMPVNPELTRGRLWGRAMHRSPAARAALEDAFCAHVGKQLAVVE